jgi:hypothetical protein
MDLIITLKFDDKAKDELEFGKALTKFGKLLNIKAAKVTNRSNKKFLGLELDATRDEINAITTIFERNKKIIAPNQEDEEAPYRAVFISQKSYDAFRSEAEDRATEAVILLYRAYNRDLNQPGHFVSATLVDNPSGGVLYRAKLANLRNVDFSADMLAVVPDGTYVILESALLPKHKSGDDDFSAHDEAESGGHCSGGASSSSAGAGAVVVASSAYYYSGEKSSCVLL